MKCVRIVSPTEAQRSFIKVESTYRKMFPPLLTPFILIIGKKRGEVKIDRQHRIWLSRIKFEINLQTNDKLEIIKNNDDTYSLFQIGASIEK